MNKVINIFSGVVLALYCALVMALVYDLSLSSTISLRGLPYKVEICAGFSLLVLLLGILRIKRKWQGATDMKRFKNFEFERFVSRSALNLSLVYTLAEAVFMGFLIYFLFQIAALWVELAFPMMLVISFLLLETLVFAVKIMRGGSSFRIGINKKAVAYFNREMHLFYFVGLMRVEMHQDMINFQYTEDLNILLPIEVIKKEDRAAFRDALIDVLENKVMENKGKRIYIDDAFRNLN